MSSSPDDAGTDAPADASGGTPPGSSPDAAPAPADASAPRRPRAALVFDDPLDQQSSDDTDQGWGERPHGGGTAADLRRFLDEKPPHHL
ncbi:hypothetical protein [Streptomyces fragilis]|uniref:Uncharacterized protein n=1 Tax=Streptomyces fragilis TaxID=67301 RepID=A0ABV2YCK4_9ACTN|nr:hypothetical protein [Streptomyces fragilis]